MNQQLQKLKIDYIMKESICIVFIFCFFSCNSHSQNKQQSPIGDSIIQNIDFVNSIEKNCTKDYNESCSLNKLKFDYHQIGNKLIYKDKNAKAFIKSDSVKNAYNQFNYRSHLYIEKGNAKKDSLLIYNEVNNEYSVDKTFCYIRDNLIYLLSISIDDEGVSVIDWQKKLIDLNSLRFENLDHITKTTKEENNKEAEHKSLEDFRKEFVSKNQLIFKEFDIDYDFDGLDDKILIIRNKNTTDSSEGNNDGLNSILILKKTKENLYKLNIYSSEVLPTDCSFGLAEPDLDIYFNDDIFHFRGLYLSNDQQIYSRDFYFDESLNLEKVILKHSIIGNELKDERLIDKNLIGNVNIKDFKYINFLEDKW